jgi:hypothetical protein
MAEEFIKTIYHVVKVNSDDSFNPTTKNIIYTGEKQDAQEIFSKRVVELQDSELYALVCERRIIKVLAKQRDVAKNGIRELLENKQ